MAQQLIQYSKLKSIDCGVLIRFKVILDTPETKWSNPVQSESDNKLKARTGRCCKIFGRYGIRGERLIKLGDIWFFTKYILV